MNMQILLMLPKLMGLSDKILRIVQGKPEPGDVREVLEEIHNLIKMVPQLAGFLLLLEPVLKIVQRVGEELFLDPDKASELGLTDDEIRQGRAVTELLQPVLVSMHQEMMKAAANVEAKDVDGLTE
jgi:predicted Zn-ribbon and HTH transcriptional regulator